MRRGTKATWQRHAGPRGDVTYELFIYIYMGYSTYKSSDYQKIIIIPLTSSHIINLLPSFNFLRVGLSSTEFLNVQVMWQRERCRIGWSVDHRASIAWTHGPPIAIKITCFNKGIITVLIKSRATHLDRQIAIQGAKTHAFYNASHQASSGPSIKIGRLRLN